MKVTDLMIGDWVKTNPNSGKLECGIKSSIAMVSEIGFSYSNGMYVSFAGIIARYYDNEIEPIPLTSEILEKNGFKKYPYKNSYWYCDEMLELFIKIVCIFPIKDRELYSLLSTATPRLTAGEDDVYIRCDYVHELQRALKLCGIEKEIVL